MEIFCEQILQDLTNLSSLVIYGNITIESIASLSKLTRLSSDSTIFPSNFLTFLPNLEHFAWWGAGIDFLEILRLKKLKTLSTCSGNIEDMDMLSQFTDLTTLKLAFDGLTERMVFFLNFSIFFSNSFSQTQEKHEKVRLLLDLFSFIGQPVLFCLIFFFNFFSFIFRFFVFLY